MVTFPHIAAADPRTEVLAPNDLPPLGFLPSQAAWLLLPKQGLQLQLFSRPFLNTHALAHLPRILCQATANHCEHHVNR